MPKKTREEFIKEKYKGFYPDPCKGNNRKKRREPLQKQRKKDRLIVFEPKVMLMPDADGRLEKVLQHGRKVRQYYQVIEQKISGSEISLKRIEHFEEV